MSSNSNKSAQNEIKENFDFAVEQIRLSDPNTPNGPSDNEKLKFYALYKQATIGKCNVSQPWAISFVEKAKWDAWNNLGNMSKNDAMIKYCDLYMQTSSKYE
jgi:acyl-CoA-binding protein